MNTPLEQAPGFFGKLVQQGDFVSRRLTPNWIALWDRWLRACLHHSQQQLASAWPAAYKASPIWRFALAAGVCDAHAWVGIVMPSSDRVGRPFPLTIALATAAEASILKHLQHPATWFEQIERLAVSSFEHTCSLAQFDAALLALERPGFSTSSTLALKQNAQQNTPGRASSAALYRLPLANLGALDASASRLAATEQSGSGNTLSSLWWNATAAQPGSLLACQGLPSPAAFCAMLNGRWAEHGWRNLA
ncbi:MAG: type VI secretion system-associated protein TagF [Pseudomonadota bacterium]